MENHPKIVFRYDVNFVIDSWEYTDATLESFSAVRFTYQLDLYPALTLGKRLCSNRRGMIDLEMPDMDGYALIEAVRRQDRDVPVMAVTGRVVLAEKAKAQAAGFSDFVGKPLTDIATFYALIIKHLNAHLSEARLLSVAGRDDLIFCNRRVQPPESMPGMF